MDDLDDRALIRGLEGFHDRRFLTFTVLGVLVVAVVMAVVVAGFRKNQVYRSADAMMLVQPSPPQVSAALPAGSAR
jgi:hypothetical protein